MIDPFLITGPAVISFSGGRTSGYMLWRILQAHDGTLPDDVVVLFQNTGREMPATLDFVRDCGAAWNAPVRWLEYRWAPGGASYIEVSHNSASRDGEPFEQLIAGKSMLPNPVARFCTIELKIRTAYRFIRTEFGWDKWTNIIGLRADESVRAERALARGNSGKDRWSVAVPLHAAGVDEFEVLKFWRAQAFDLRLAGSWEGNCDGCFLKSRGSVARMFRDHPERMAWWPAQENHIHHGKGMGTTFRADREDYSAIRRLSRDQGSLDFYHESDIPCADAMCGV